MRLNVAIFVLITICFQNTVARSTELVLAGNSWVPYSEFSRNGPTGIAIDKVMKIAKKAGFQIKVIHQPFLRSLNSAERATIDGLVLAAETSDRKEFLAFTKPIFCDRRYFFTRKEHVFNWQVTSELKGRTLSTGLGYYNGSFIEELFANGTLKKSAIADADGLLPMLILGRSELTLYSERQAEMELKLLPGAEEITRLEPPVYKNELRLGFTIKNNGIEHREAFNKAIDQLNLAERC